MTSPNCDIKFWPIAFRDYGRPPGAAAWARHTRRAPSLENLDTEPVFVFDCRCRDLRGAAPWLTSSTRTKPSRGSGRLRELTAERFANPAPPDAASPIVDELEDMIAGELRVGVGQRSLAPGRFPPFGEPFALSESPLVQYDRLSRTLAFARRTRLGGVPTLAIDESRQRDRETLAVTVIDVFDREAIARVARDARPFHPPPGPGAAGDQALAEFLRTVLPGHPWARLSEETEWSGVLEWTSAYWWRETCTPLRPVFRAQARNHQLHRQYDHQRAHARCVPGTHLRSSPIRREQIAPCHRQSEPPAGGNSRRWSAEHWCVTEGGTWRAPRRHRPRRAISDD